MDNHGLTSPWMSQAVFQVSVQNDPPTAPFPLLPLDGETLYTATPTLQWLDSLDPEGASLTYQVEVYSDKHLTALVASVSGLPGTLLTTSWQVTPALLEKTTYYWRVRGSDGALSSAWSGTQSFKVGKLTTGGTPRYFAVKPGGLNGRRVATIGSLGGLTGGETEAIFFYQADHLGTPLMMTDQTGQVVWQAEYLPFGEPVTINEDVDGDGVTVVNHLRFPGQYFDQETTLHYNTARDYRPVIGRYIESDRIGLNGGINLYAYVGGNPTVRIDPLGLFQANDILGLWNHYCEGTGTSTAVSFASINWGDTQQRAIDEIKTRIGQSCTEQTIPVNFTMEGQAAGVDRAVIGRHTVRIQGTLQVHCNCTWTFSGEMSSVVGYDPYNFNPSNRGLLGELSAWIGRNRCPNTGKTFDIFLCGRLPISASGTIGQQ